jgi:hypothetical protein
MEPLVLCCVVEPRLFCAVEPSFFCTAEARFFCTLEPRFFPAGELLFLRWAIERPHIQQYLRLPGIMNPQLGQAFRLYSSGTMS